MIRVTIVGSGRRVLTAPLPVLQQLQSDFTLQTIFAKKGKVVQSGGVDYNVIPLEKLGAGDVDRTDLLLVAVSKPAVPAVLSAFCRFDVSRVDLLIDTPVVLLKHFRHLSLLRKFRHAWVAEDCSTLPFFDAVRLAASRGLLGELTGATFDRSAYAYHGVATLKSLLGPARVVRARRTRISGDAWKRIYYLSNGHTATVIEPRDYSAGKITIHGSKADLCDFDRATPPAVRLAPIVEAGECTGFRAGTEVSTLDARERALMAGGGGESVTARMEAMKRVGFLRLLLNIQKGVGAYPVEEAVDDMVIDSLLAKTGFYRATPFTDARRAPARALFSIWSRVAGR
jgi:hypothetical protein